MDAISLVIVLLAIAGYLNTGQKNINIHIRDILLAVLTAILVSFLGSFILAQKISIDLFSILIAGVLSYLAGLLFGYLQRGVRI